MHNRYIYNRSIRVIGNTYCRLHNLVADLLLTQLECLVSEESKGPHEQDHLQLVLEEWCQL